MTSVWTILIALAALLAMMSVLGWIIPLVVAGIFKKHGIGGARGWYVFAALWGVVVLCLFGAILAVSLETMSPFRSMVSDDSDVVDFNPGEYSGPSVQIKSGCDGECFLIASVDDKGARKYTASNGVFVLPACKMKVSRYSMQVKDDKNTEWTISGKFWSGVEIDISEGTEKSLKVGPPLNAGVQLTWSGASRNVSISPACSDAFGNEFDICPDSKSADAIGFEFVDAADKVVWKGSFEFG